MKKLLFLLAAIWPAYVYAADPQFRSLENGFRLFVTESRGADFETQLANWQRDVETQASEIYLHILANEDQGQLEAARRKAAKQLFPFLLENSDAILSEFTTFQAAGKPIIQKLAARYPSVDMSSVEVWAMPSLDKFNGQVATIQGRVRVMFGMDMIAQIKQKGDFRPGAILINDLPVLMAHEFTHALHYRMSDFGQGDPTSASFWGPLWDEGLAQVNSQILVPGTDLPNVFMERNLAKACSPDNIRSWSASYLVDSTLDDAHIEDAYARWFMLSAGLEEHAVYRAGYCLGYYVILSALQNHSMEEILKMNRAQAYDVGRSTLTEFANAGAAGKNPPTR